MRAIHVRQFGGPEVLQPVTLPDPVPERGELLVRVTGVGVNYADTHQTENSYLTGMELPFVPGMEVVGFTQTAGSETRRVCGFVSRGGGYAELATVHQAQVFEVPDSVSDAAALSLLVQGLTAWHLVRTSARVQPGETVVVHAAAGGVGNLAVQLAKAALSLGVVEWSGAALASVVKLHAATWLVGGALQALSAAYLTRVVGRAMADYLALAAGVPEAELDALLQRQAPLLVARAAEEERIDWAGFLQQGRQWLAERQRQCPAPA